MTPRFFELVDHVGVDPYTGDLEPLVEQGLLIGRYDLVTGRPYSQRVVLRPVEAGSRTVCATDPAVVKVLEQHPFYREVDLPIGLRPRRPRVLSPSAKEA